ncbi:L,D-transpeptidase [Streptomyces sp. BI20]|uniref:L,D-transpeptidase n=1 Tax=Streptomyces sp. BI20 TaxID=3403460 RepID=UPI003C74F757
MSRIPRSPISRRPVRRVALAGTAAVLAAALAACGGADSGGSDAKGGAGDAPKTPMAISVNLTGDAAKPGEPVKVTLTEGRLAQVKVTDAKGAELPGKIANDGRTWTSERNAAPGTTYTVTAQDTHSRDAKATFGTAKADKVNKLSIYPGKDTTVGVAQPISLVFDNPVKNKADVEKHLKVTTDNNTEGSWGWFKDYSGNDRVDWRPKDYWKSGTKVKVEMNLNGVDSGSGGGYFVRDYDTSFAIGKDRRMKVDLDAKEMTVTQDGEVVQTIPVSAGTPGGKKASWSGKMVLMSKEGTIRMDSQTVGLGDSYDKMVDYSMRVTWSGMYVHAAPWNAGVFGVANTSSGCVGMSDANAAELFAAAQIGDLVEVVGEGSKGQAEIGNGYGEWNLSWPEWQSKSALTNTPQNG